MAEKRKSSYPLEEIKKSFADPERLNRTFTATKGAEDLGMDEEAVVAVIAGLTNANFDKSMTAYHDHTLWQDVYKPAFDGRQLYVKFTRDAQGSLLLISFKGNDDA